MYTPVRLCNGIHILKIKTQSCLILQRSMLFNLSSRSHDGFQEDETGYLRPAADKYADQRKVFDDLGGGVLKNAIEGKLQ